LGELEARETKNEGAFMGMLVAILIAALIVFAIYYLAIGRYRDRDTPRDRELRREGDDLDGRGRPGVTREFKRPNGYNNTTPLRR
jgi:hypothetical protein